MNKLVTLHLLRRHWATACLMRLLLLVIWLTPWLEPNRVTAGVAGMSNCGCGLAAQLAWISSCMSMPCSDERVATECCCVCTLLGPAGECMHPLGIQRGSLLCTSHLLACICRHPPASQLPTQTYPRTWLASRKRMVSTEPFHAPWMSMGVSRLRERTYEKPSRKPRAVSWGGGSGGKGWEENSVSADRRLTAQQGEAQHPACATQHAAQQNSTHSTSPTHLWEVAGREMHHATG